MRFPAVLRLERRDTKESSIPMQGGLRSSKFTCRRGQSPQDTLVGLRGWRSGMKLSAPGFNKRK